MKQILILLLSLTFFSGCAQKTFTQGKYDKDVKKENLLNDQWSETDMQKAVTNLVSSLEINPALNSHVIPVVIITQLQNKTLEKIDTQSVMDMVRVELMKTKKIAFVDKEARADILAEYEYQKSGAVSKESQKSAGGQIGADYLLNGRLDSITQEVGKEKTVYYKITLNLTNLKTGMIAWSDHQQIRKIYKKKTVGK